MSNRYPVMFGTGVVALVLAGVFWASLFIQRSIEVERHAEGAHQIQLLYLRACTIGNVRDEIPIDSAEEEIAYCNRLAKDGEAGYYVYDFTIRRSVHVDRELMDVLVEHDVLSFPSSIYGKIQSGSNRLNTIIPFAEFAEFAVSCEEMEDSLACAVNGETHFIEKMAGLDLLLPQVMVSGSDWYKTLKPVFFPYLR